MTAGPVARRSRRHRPSDVHRLCSNTRVNPPCSNRLPFDRATNRRKLLCWPLTRRGDVAHGLDEFSTRTCGRWGVRPSSRRPRFDARTLNTSDRAVPIVFVVARLNSHRHAGDLDYMRVSPAHARLVAPFNCHYVDSPGVSAERAFDDACARRERNQGVQGCREPVAGTRDAARWAHLRRRIETCALDRGHAQAR